MQEELKFLELLSEPRVFAALITAVPTLLIALSVGIFTLYRYKKDSKENRNILIKTQLNEFYSPILSYLNTSHTLYMILKANKQEDFVLLIYLLNTKERDNLSDSDHELIKEILRILKKVESLIIKKSGLISDTSLKFTYDDKLYKEKLENLKNILINQNKDIKKYIYGEMEDLSLLSHFLINYRLLDLAYNKKLIKDNSSANVIAFAETFTFPKDINNKIRDNILELQKELNS